jgi:hypothetical protein
MQFWEWLRLQQAADELFLHEILPIDEARFILEGALSVHNSHFWVWDNPHLIRYHKYEVRFGIMGALPWTPVCYLTG